MEDARVQVAARHAGGELDTVLRRRGHHVRIGRLRKVRVHEVHPIAVADVRERGRAPADGQPIPSHVGHLQAETGGKAHHAAAEYPEPPDAGRLLAFLEEDLHADADAEERPAGSGGLAYGADQPGAREILHARPERALPRQDDAGRARDASGVAGHECRLPEMLEGFLRAVEVSDAVVDDGERLAHPASVPLVDGTPRTRGSCCVAASSARARPLNAASITWCGLRPASMR